MKPILLGTAFAAVACMTIIALILSLANRQTLDHPYSEQVKRLTTVSQDAFLTLVNTN